MVDSPHVSPYLPNSVAQQPKLYMPMNPTDPRQDFTKIHSVNGFPGARQYAHETLAPGCSNIIADSDPNIARVYIVGKDQNGQIIVSGYRLIPEEEPKPVTMDDISNQLSELINRVSKLEEASTNGSTFKPGITANGANIASGKPATGNDKSSTGNSSKSS